MAEKITPLTDGELEGVAGGAGEKTSGFTSTPACPQCGGTNVRLIDFPDNARWHCYDCGYEWDFTY